MTTKADETVRMEDRGSPRVLVVDDEPHIVELVRYNLQQEGFAVSVATSGREALARVASDRPDLVVLDIMLPELDGIEVCRQIRAESRVPILMLTARDRELDRVVGLETGPLQSEGLALHPETHEVWLRGRAVDLTAKEFELLKLLMRHPNRVFTRDFLLEHIWGYDYFGSTRTVDMHISRLREKIEDDPACD